MPTFGNMLDSYVRLYSQCWKTKTTPNNWKRVKIILLFKEGDKNNPQNYRGITLLICTRI